MAEDSPDQRSLQPLIKHERPRTVSDFFSLLSSPNFKSDRWIFRGQGRSSWSLQPSLERFANAHWPKLLLPDSIESRVLPEFYRRARHYTKDIPEPGDRLEWLSLMRHHGGPSRLLDFTKSPYVAAFFALAAAQRDHEAAIWAIDRDSIVPRACDRLSGETVAYYRTFAERARRDRGTTFSDPDAFNLLIDALPPASVVVPVEPKRMNERMLLQQGLFLCPLSLFQTFEQCLINVLPESGAAEPVLYKITTHPPEHRGLLRELERMNISFATLTPGLDGLVRSIAMSAAP